MAQVKLDLSNKSVPDKIQKGRQAVTALGRPAAPYTALAATLETATSNLETAENAAKQLELDLAAAYQTRDEAEAVFGAAYGALGGQVQVTTGGVESAIAATGYEVRSEARPVTSLDGVHAFTATTTNLPGTFDFTWDKEKGALNYEIRGRLESAPAGEFVYHKTISKTRLRAGGFQSGAPYLFSIRSFGTKEMESPWSDEFRKIAS
jgi:hypothetical protein